MEPGSRNFLQSVFIWDLVKKVNDSMSLNDK